MTPGRAGAGVLLAAGAGRRMGEAGKLLLPLAGVPILRRSAELLLAAGLDPLVVVLGDGHREMTACLAGLPVQLCVNHRCREGMGTSLAAGVAAIPAEVRTLAVALADMPLVRPATVRRLVHRAANPQAIAVPVYAGRRGHPVVFDLSTYRDELLGLASDAGARSVLERWRERVVPVAVGDPGVCLDVDTPADLAALRRALGGADAGAGG